jgi:hypothetical protein
MYGPEDTMRRHALAAGLSLLLAVTACGTGKEAAKPSPTTTPSPASGETVSPGPSAREWLTDLDTDGTSLYVTSHSCPRQVEAGVCTIKGSTSPERLKAFPLTLWRYTGGRWEDLGQPGVFSYSDMTVLPGGFMFAPLTEPHGGAVIGPLRVSVDDGATWADWPIPQEKRRCINGFSGPGRGPCTVAVAGDYVVIASNYGWIRRNLHSGGWEAIALPKRARMYDFDGLGYGLLTLADGTLIATANNPGSEGPNGFFRVSQDFGATWSGPRGFPGKHSDAAAVDGSALYAACQGKNYNCGWYRSTDLEHWRKATDAEAARLNDGRPVPCVRAVRPTDGRWRFTETAVRVGEIVYAISYVPYLKGREVTRKEFPILDAPHRIRHVLERAADSCRTWEAVPVAPE